MRREIKIERARKLRKEGWSYARIGKRYGVSHVTVWQWLNPKAAEEKARRSNAKRTAQKREWARDHRAHCPDCGCPMGAGSKGRSNGPKRCKECQFAQEAEQVHERAIQIEEWWAEGLKLREIAERLDWTLGHLTVEIHHLREKGYHLPYRRAVHSTADRQPRFPDQVAA